MILYSYYVYKLGMGVYLHNACIRNTPVNDTPEMDISCLCVYLYNFPESVLNVSNDVVIHSAINY